MRPGLPKPREHGPHCGLGHEDAGGRTRDSCGNEAGRSRDRSGAPVHQTEGRGRRLPGRTEALPKLLGRRRTGRQLTGDDGCGERFARRRARRHIVSRKLERRFELHGVLLPITRIVGHGRRRRMSQCVAAGNAGSDRRWRDPGDHDPIRRIPDTFRVGRPWASDPSGSIPEQAPIESKSSRQSARLMAIPPVTASVWLSCPAAP